MKKTVFFLILAIFLCSVYADTAYFDVLLEKPDNKSVFTLYKSWDMEHPTELRFRDGVWKRTYELETGNYYFIEIRDKDDRIWYAYKFTMNGPEKLRKDLGIQKVSIFAEYKEDKGDLFVIYDDNQIELEKDRAGKEYEVVLELPVDREVTLYFQNKDDSFNFGPVEFTSANVIDRDMKLELDFKE
ncbi:MAG: hypothetical protein ACOCWO_04830 [Candidatus Muiribacteriaceae bacterium]